MKEIIVTISPEGVAKVEAKGYAGQTCLKATAPYEVALGTVLDKGLKDEYYNATQAQEGVNDGN